MSGQAIARTDDLIVRIDGLADADELVSWQMTASPAACREAPHARRRGTAGPPISLRAAVAELVWSSFALPVGVLVWVVARHRRNRRDAADAAVCGPQPAPKVPAAARIACFHPGT